MRNSWWPPMTWLGSTQLSRAVTVGEDATMHAAKLDAVKVALRAAREQQVAAYRVGFDPATQPADAD